MKAIYSSVLILFLAGCAKNEKLDSASELSPKAILLQQLKTTHNVKEWFVPVNDALEGVTSMQAMWRDSSGNHSIGQLTYHLLFWNRRQLAKFQDTPLGNSPENNDETFTAFTEDQWEKTVSGLDSVLTALEKSVADADEQKLKSWYATLANISTHNAYHTGQILYIRKYQQSWDAAKGVR
jgi:hypothetical protein